MEAHSTGSMFDIVDQKSPTASPLEAPNASCRLPKEGPARVNFLYMGLFLGFGKIRSPTLTYA